MRDQGRPRVREVLSITLFPSRWGYPETALEENMVASPEAVSMNEPRRYLYQYIDPDYEKSRYYFDDTWVYYPTGGRNVWVQHWSRGNGLLITHTEIPQIFTDASKRASWCTCTIPSCYAYTDWDWRCITHKRVARVTKSGEFLWKSYGHRGNSPESMTPGAASLQQGQNALQPAEIEERLHHDHPEANNRGCAGDHVRRPAAG